MDRQELSRLAHSDHPIAAPLSDRAVTDVIHQALESTPQRLLDLGCGSAEWLIRALEHSPTATAVGVDTSTPALAHARQEAQRRGVSDRLTLLEQDAATFEPQAPFDVVLNVAATHVFGGLHPTVAAAQRHLTDSGRLVIGEGFWASPPTDLAIEFFGELDDLATTVASVVADGWTPLHGHVSTRAELDAYEWSWTGSLAKWARQHPGTEDADQALTVSRDHLDGWLRGYRDCFGFLTLVLSRS